MFIQRLLGLVPREAPASDRDSATVRRIVSELESMQPAQARYLAAFAFILSRVADSDSHISPEETRAMEQAVARWGGLTPAQTVLVVQIAKSQAVLFGATEDFLVTRQFKEMSTPEQRTDLVHCLFAVSAADDSISSVEEAAIRQIASELGFADREYLGLRSGYNDKRAVLKNFPKEPQDPA